MESAYFLLPWFSIATLLPLGAAYHLLIRNSFPSLSLFRSTVHVSCAVLAKCTDCQAINEYKIMFSSVSPTLLLFQNGAVPFLWDWSGLSDTTARLAALPLSLCSACVQLRCLYLQVISTVGHSPKSLFHCASPPRTSDMYAHAPGGRVYSRVLACNHEVGKFSHSYLHYM